MIAYIILGVVLGLPLLLGLIFRVNPSFIFFSILAGELLARYFGDDAELVGRLAFKNDQFLAFAELTLLILPIILTALFLRNTLSKGKLFLYLIPFLITGFVLAAFTLPILPENLQDQVRSVHEGQYLLEGSETIVGAVVVLQLITLWAMNRSHKKPEKKH